MPVIEIAMLAPPADLDVARALGDVATTVADHLGEEPSGTWTILTPIPSGHYAEGRDAPAEQPRTTHPAIARVFARPDDRDVRALLVVVGDAVTRAFGLAPGNVVVRFEPADPDRMYWG